MKSTSVARGLALVGLASLLSACAGPAASSTPGDSLDPDDAQDGQAVLPADVLRDFPDEVDLAPGVLDPSGEEGLRFGRTTRDDVVDRFGMPGDMQERDDRTSFAYKGSDAFPGLRQVIFHFDEDGLLVQFETFPAAVIRRAQVEETYQAPAVVKPAGRGFEVLIYPALGMLVYLTADQVHSVRFSPIKLEGPPRSGQREEEQADEF